MAFSSALTAGRRGRAQQCPSQRPQPQRAWWRHAVGGPLIRETPRWMPQMTAAQRHVSIVIADALAATCAEKAHNGEAYLPTTPRCPRMEWSNLTPLI